MQAYEIPKAVYLECDRWTPATELLTISYKLARQNLRKHYAAIVQQLYM